MPTSHDDELLEKYFTRRSDTESVGSLKSNSRLILSVDDEPGILLTRQSILENAGYAVLSASDGD